MQADDARTNLAAVRYDGEFELSWLGPGERVKSAGNGTGACVIVRADGTEQRVEIGDEILRPAAPAAVRREYVTALACGHGRPTVSNYPPTTGSITRCTTCGRWVGVIVHSKERK